MNPETYFKLVQNTIEQNGGTELAYLKKTRKHFLECIMAQYLVEGYKVPDPLIKEYEQILTDLNRKKSGII